MKKFLLPLAAFTMLAMNSTAEAGTIDFSYNPVEGRELVWGSKKAEVYDVAIFINDPVFVGAKVTGMRVLLPLNDTQVQDVTAWMSQQLTIENKVNVPDILSEAATITDEYLDITFSKPYTITENGVYVGYSFTIPEVDLSNSNDPRKEPVAVQYGDNENGFWFHSSRSQLKWKNMQKVLGAVSTMVVRIEGDFYDESAGVTLAGHDFIGGEAQTVGVSIINHGSAAINNIEYTCKIADKQYAGTYDFENPIGNVFNMSRDIDLPIASPKETGKYPMELTITKVNGVDNKDNMRTLSCDVQVIPFVPVNRPLVEEYTGLWCGYCPRGYVALETMNELYPDEFIALAWHNGDDMAITSRYPNSIPGFPDCYINRSTEMDPMYIQSKWGSFRTEIPIADVNIDLEWADSEMTSIKATAHTTFIGETSDSYKLSFAVVFDGLKNDSWAQSNYYAGQAGQLTGKYAELFTGGKSKVKGLIFNDVVGYYPASDFYGIDNSLPAKIVPGVTYDTDYVVNLSDAVNTNKKQISQWLSDPNQIRVVAIIFTDSKQFVNCNTSGYLAPVSVDTINGVDAEVVETVYYDLNGRKVSNPEKGIFVKVDMLSNGARRTSKVAR